MSLIHINDINVFYNFCFLIKWVQVSVNERRIREEKELKGKKILEFVLLMRINEKANPLRRLQAGCDKYVLIPLPACSWGQIIADLKQKNGGGLNHITEPLHFFITRIFFQKKHLCIIYIDTYLFQQH